MRATDARALEEVSEEILVERAGTAVATVALSMLGGTYGRRVSVVAGKGNNGADGRVAAAILSRRGARVTVYAAEAAPSHLEPCDLVIDAAYGTGFKGSYEAPVLEAEVPVLAVDIPSGVDGDTGAASGRPLQATRTVTFAALKTGLVQADGARLAGRIEVVDIGLGVEGAQVACIEDADCDRLAPPGHDAHKWSSALLVVAGSPGMEGAAVLSSRGASHAGAGMVRLAVPGAESSLGPVGWPTEAVRVQIHATKFAEDLAPVLQRCRALVIGPGLGQDPATHAEVRSLLAGSPVPVVADADALSAIGPVANVKELTASMSAPLVLTPHDGEYQKLVGDVPGSDRILAARSLAEETGAVVLLKGPLTVIARPSGVRGSPGMPPTLLVNSGSPRLATAGTGDVLSGVIGAFCARGLDPQVASALGAHVHGRAASLGPLVGLVAGDLPDLVRQWLSLRAAEVAGG
jgi:hydroxyethylthiazole kinase-like uncharacterized protein yjeF